MSKLALMAPFETGVLERDLGSLRLWNSQSRSSTRRGEVNNVRFVHGDEKFPTDEKRMPLEMVDVVATSSISPTRPCCMRRRDPR